MTPKPESHCKGRHGASLQFQVPLKNYTQHTFANKNRVPTLPKTNIAMENPPFWWNLLGNIGIFMGELLVSGSSYFQQKRQKHKFQPHNLKKNKEARNKKRWMTILALDKNISNHFWRSQGWGPP